MIGRVGIGVIVRTGAVAPNIRTPDALKQAVLAADAVVYNTAGSGQSVQKMFEDMGISAQIQSKANRPANAAQTMDRIIQGKGNEIGFGLISEIKPYETKGVRMVGPLPVPVQTYINYEAILSAGSKLADDAKRFIRLFRHLGTPAREETVFASHGSGLRRFEIGRILHAQKSKIELCCRIRLSRMSDICRFRSFDFELQANSLQFQILLIHS